jgi:amino acid adenylation domain-containing protein
MPEIVYYPLSSPQISIWNTEMAYPGTSISNIAATLRIEENIDFEVLEKAINLFIKANDGIRIKLKLNENGNPVQYVSEYEPRKIELKNFSAFDDPKRKLYQWDSMMTSRSMELIESDLYRVFMVKVSDSDAGLYMNVHHIITDAWSISLIGSEIMRHYYALLNGENSESEMPSYIDYIKKEEEYLNSPRFQKDALYWNSLFDEKPELTILKSNKNNAFSTVSKRKTFILPKKFARKLEDYCANSKVSKYQVFIAGLSAYIFRVTSQKNIIIGTPILNRTTAQEKKTVGMFISTVPLKISISNDTSFDSFVKNVSDEVLMILRHQRYPYDKLLRETRQRHDLKDNLFDIVFSYQNSKLSIEGEKEFASRWHFNGHQSNSLTIHISDRDDGGDLIMDYDYHEHLFFDKEIEFIHNHFLSLLWHALDDPSKKITGMEMISEREKKKILFDFNNTEADYDRTLTVHRIFERQAEKTPDKAALQFGNMEISYQELNSKANRLAWELVNYGVKADMPVGIIAYRSFEMVIGILAILKAGGAYVPIDPKAPADRIDYIVNNSGVKIILTSCKMELQIANVNIFNINDIPLDRESDRNLPDTSGPHNLIYIIYTSGSTGQPKGVMIEHFSIVNRINWMQKEFPLDKSDCILQKTPYTFDVSVWELFWWFFAGARLALLTPDGEKNPETILSAISQYRITTMHFVPSMFKSFIGFLTAKSRWPELNQVRRIFSSGEALPINSVNEFMNCRTGSTELVNLYGPTEAAVDVTCYRCISDGALKTIPIGRPIDNIQLYILDSNLNIQPIGTVGELYISGDGLARGYINHPDLTEKSFIANPFLPGKRMYKTGDLARWYPEGDIEYIGRADHQIKIRGHRVELNEIKLQIMKNSSVKDALVTCRERESAKHIYAYIIFDGTGDVDLLKNELRKVFPAYMIPSFFIELDTFPLSGNGKVDLKMLPEPQTETQKIVAPRNDFEKELVMIWEEILKVRIHSVQSNFFDLGGDSLTAIQLITRLNNISVEDVYQNPTIEQLANKITGMDDDNDRILIPYRRFDIKRESAIVCFPYGGGSSIIYQDLFSEISKAEQKYGLFSVNLPGHGDYTNKEQEYLPLEAVGELITGELIKLGIKEVILYGHCVGSALTLLTAERLQKVGINVQAVCMGGVLPPKFAKYYGNHLYPWAFVSDRFMLNYLKRIGFNAGSVADEIMPLILNAFRYDVKCFYKYFYEISRNGSLHLNAPLYSIIGDEDPLTGNYRRNYKEWLNYADKVTLKVIPDANHYFIKSHPEQMAKILLEIQEEAVDIAI